MGGSLWERATSSVAGLASDAYHAATDWHFEGRHAHNQSPDHVRDLEDPANGWQEMSAKEAVYHNNNQGQDERKFVRDDENSFLGLGGHEAVWDPDAESMIEEGPYRSTYNYVNPAGLGDWSPGGIARNVGHFALDVVPYWFGGTERGDEGTNFGQRVLGPENYEKAAGFVNGAVDTVSDGLSSVGDAVSSGWNSVTDTVGGWFD